jgi:hypothetical protein
MAQTKGAAGDKGSMFEGILEALADKHSQLDINFQGMSIRMFGVSAEFSGLISITAHIRDITEGEKKASSGKNVALMSKG